MEEVLTSTFKLCVERPSEQNWVKRVYEPFTNEEIAAKIAQILTPDGVKCPVEIIYQTLSGLHSAVPNHSGDWYFSGDYPTEGGTRLVNRAFADWFVNHSTDSKSRE